MLSVKRKIEGLLTRIRELLYRASTDPHISREALLELVDHLESLLTDVVLSMTGGQKIQISLFPTFFEYEKLLTGQIESLRASILSGNFAKARRELESLRSHFYSYLRIASAIFAGKGVEEAKIQHVGVKAPEGLSYNALRVYAYLLQRTGGEADIITIQKALNMSDEDLENAINELRDMGYIDTYLRGMSTVIKLKEGVA